MQTKIDLSVEFALIKDQIEPLYENNEKVSFEAINSVTNDNFIDVYNYLETLSQLGVTVVIKVPAKVSMSFIALINAGVILVAEKESKLIDENNILGRSREIMTKAILKAKKNHNFKCHNLDWAHKVI